LFPVDGASLVALGVSPGPGLGKTLRALESAWVDSNFSLSKENLLARAVENTPR
jgi:hypothetical protein